MMGKIRFLLVCLSLMSGVAAQVQAQRYLALGDSYTIGEGVEEKDRFPVQFSSIMKEHGQEMNEVQIIARTGWTTDELLTAIKETNPVGPFDWVTLLIGVNNQYRGRDVESYKDEFTLLLKKATELAGGDTQRVLVLSIPDWGVTPFAGARNVDAKKVASEINSYNKAKRAICKQAGITYIDITRHYRKYGGEEFVSDRLHPNAFMYRHWAEQLWQNIKS